MKIDGIRSVYMGMKQKRKVISFKKRVEAIQETNRIFEVYDKNGNSVYSGVPKK